MGPNHCDGIVIDADGENVKDAFGNSVGGLRTCLLNYPTGTYHSTSMVERGTNAIDPESDQNGVFVRFTMKDKRITLFHAKIPQPHIPFCTLRG